jgi:SNF2 family DNA or RNA helicase
VLTSAFDLSSTTQPSSLPFLDAASINLLEMQSERPAFPCTEEQRAIGPFVLDVDDESMAIPSPINRFLREYQRAGTQFMYTKYRHGMGGILGDDMG